MNANRAFIRVYSLLIRVTLFASLFVSEPHSVGALESASASFRNSRSSINSGGQKKTSSSFSINSSVGEIVLTTHTSTNFQSRSGLITIYYFPGKTTDFAAVPGTQPGTVDLSWTSLGNDAYAPQTTAKSYIIKLSSTPGLSPALSDEIFNAAQDVTPSPPTPASQGTVQTMTVTGLLAGVTYYFALKAREADGLAGILSDETSAQATIVPPNISTPTFTDVGSSSFTVHWTSGTSPPGYNPAGTNYKAQISTNPTFSPIFDSSDTANLFATFTNLYANTTYYARAQAFAGVHQTTYTNLGSTWTLSNQVSNAQIFGMFLTSATVNWNPLPSSPPAVSSETAEGYLLEASTASNFTGTISSFSTTNVTTSNLSVQGLFPNTTYYFRVASLNWNNMPNYADAPLSSSTLSNTVQNAQIFDMYLTSATVTWTPLPSSPPDASSKTAEGYLLEASTASNFTGTISSFSTTNVATNNLTVQGLFPNTTYYFRVASLNWNTMPSNYAFTGSSYTLANPVLNAQVSSVAQFAITANWNPLPSSPPDASSKTAEGYLLETSSTSDFSTLISFSSTTDITLSTLTLNNLISDKIYYLRVASLNWSNKPNYITIGSTRTLPSFAPPPINPVISAMYLSSAAVSWGTVASQGYVVESSTGSLPNAFTGNKSSVTVDGNLATLTVVSLDPNTPYYFRVGSLFSGNTTYADTVPVSSSTLSNPVLNAQIFEVFQTSVTANWNPLPTTPSSSTAEGYRLEASTASNFIGTILSSSTLDIGLSTLTVSGLSANTTYFFRVGSLNWNNTANYITIGSTKTLIGPPPTNPVISVMHISSAAITWGTVASQGYVVESSTRSHPNAFTGNKSSVTIDGNLAALTTISLNPNTTYFFRVGALWNGATSYADTLPISSSTLSNPVLNAQIFGMFLTSATVNWNPLPTTPQDQTAEGYRLEASTASSFIGTIFSSSTLDIGLSTLTVSGLSANTTYYFRVGSLNWNNVAHFTTAGSSSTLADTVLNAQIYGVWTTSITANWNPLSVSPQSATAEGYVLEASTQNNFANPIYSSSTANIALSTLTLSNLTTDATYYFRVGSLNWNNVANYTVFGSTFLPRIPIASVTITSVTPNALARTITLIWSNPNPIPQNVLILRNAGSPPPVNPFNGTAYVVGDTSLGGSTVVFNGSVSTFTDTGLALNTTWYYTLYARDDLPAPNYSLGTTTSSILDLKPLYPAGLDRTIMPDLSSVTISWSGVISEEDGTPFNSPSLSEQLTQYNVYRSTDLWVTSQIIGSVSSNTLQYTDFINGQNYYYTITASDKYNQESTRSLYISSLSGELFQTTPSKQYLIRFDRDSIPYLNGGNPTGQNIYVQGQPRTSEVGGKVLQSVQFDAMKADQGQQAQLFFLPQANMEIRFYYKVSGTQISFSPQVTASQVSDMGIYQYDGRKWAKAYGRVDTANQSIWIKSGTFGPYQVRELLREAAFGVDSSGITNRFLTPNGDGLNDDIVIQVNNPADVGVGAKIFDLKGAYVSDMEYDAGTQRLKWDGKSNGSVVTSGVYVYQVEAEGKVFNGTVVVIR
ncbi:MAG: gliding motility-associated C-terminal domain-containing protein [Elusimicrobia bacterium]|nr:gliding motility-associated C-terminal domain-containing protein [Elusimicrobiota bacterium]